MTTIIARHRVGNYDTWIRAHAERAEVLGQASSSLRTFQDVDDPNSVVLVIETEEPEKLAALMADPNGDSGAGCCFRVTDIRLDRAYDRSRGFLSRFAT